MSVCVCLSRWLLYKMQLHVTPGTVWAFCAKSSVGSSSSSHSSSRDGTYTFHLRGPYSRSINYTHDIAHSRDIKNEKHSAFNVYILYTTVYSVCGGGGGGGWISLNWESRPRLYTSLLPFFSFLKWLLVFVHLSMKVCITHTFTYYT